MRGREGGVGNRPCIPFRDIQRWKYIANFDTSWNNKIVILYSTDRLEENKLIKTDSDLINVNLIKLQIIKYGYIFRWLQLTVISTMTTSMQSCTTTFSKLSLENENFSN